MEVDFVTQVPRDWITRYREPNSSEWKVMPKLDEKLVQKMTEQVEKEKGEAQKREEDAKNERARDAATIPDAPPPPGLTLHMIEMEQMEQTLPSLIQGQVKRRTHRQR